MQKKLFSNHVIILTSCAIFLFGIILSLLLRNQFLDYHTESMQNRITEQLNISQHVVDELFVDTRSELLSYSRNRYFLKLLSSTEFSNLELYQLLYNAQSCIPPQRPAKTVITYNGMRDQFYVELNATSSGEYSNPALYKFITAQPLPLNETYDIQVYENSLGDAQFVLLYIPAGQSASDASLMIEIPAHEIADRLITDNSLNAYALIVDHDGQVLLGSSDYPICSNLPADDPLYQNLTENHANFTVDIAGENCLVTAARSERFDWTYLYIVPTAALTQNLNAVIVQTLLVLACTLVLATLLLILFRFFLYWHAEQLSMLQRNYDNSLRMGYDAVQKALRLLLYASDDEAAWALCAQSGLMLHPDRPGTMILFSIDPSTPYSASSAPAVVEVITECFKPLLSTAAVCSMEKSFVLLATQSIAPEVDQLIALTREAQRRVQAQTGLSISCVVSNEPICGSDLTGMRLAFQETLANRIFYGAGMLELYSTLRNRPTGEVPSTAALDNLINLSLHGNIEEMNEVLDELFDSLKKQSFSTLKLTIMQLVCRIQVHFTANSDDYDAEQSENWFALISSMQKMLSLDELKSQVAVLLDCQLQLKRCGEDTHRMRFLKVQMQIDQAIEQNYTDASFGPDQIAAALDISVPYCKKIFKQYTNCSLSEYLTRYRLEKAAYLLKHTDIPAGSIGLQCGFYNTNYFYSLFKKHYGVTASTYRQSL